MSDILLQGSVSLGAQNKRPSGETLSSQLPKKNKPEPAAAPDSFTASELAKAKKSLVSLVARTIKKTPHNQQKKGKTSVVMGIPSREFGLALLGNHGVTASSTKQMEKREFYSHEDVAAWLGLTQNAGRLPCKFDGKFYQMQYAALGNFDVCIRTNEIKLNLKTVLAGKFWQMAGERVTLPQQYAAFETFDVCIKTNELKVNMKTVLSGGMAD